ncbi:MAG: hypothetical protein OEL85_08535 [Desulfobulbaceae bacterium]|nr:hypothetical protein [Desulfobulbaceae bacterium]
MEQKEGKLPFHRHFGLRLLQVLLVVLSLLLVKRCADIYYDNKQIDRQTEIEYFEKGYVSGMNKSRGLSEDPEPRFKNYALKKSYRDGYREGWDRGREKENQP